MDRRRFIISSGALALARFAQSSVAAGMQTVGVLWVSSPGSEWRLDVLRDSMKAQGLDPRFIRFEEDVNADRYEALDAAARRMVQKRVDVIVAQGATAAAAAAKATSSIPIVFLVTADPVKSKLVASLARPGGNATGLRVSPSDQTGKRLEYLKRLVPAARRIGHLFNESSTAEVGALKATRDMATAVGFELELVSVRVLDDLDAAIARAAKAGIQGMSVAPSTMLAANAQRVVEAAAKYRVPTVYPNSEYADAGGVLSYGPNLRVGFTLMGGYVARILKGAKPGDLPVEQSEKYELIANLAAAKRQGITIAQDLIGLADRVIQA